MTRLPCHTPACTACDPDGLACDAHALPPVAGHVRRRRCTACDGRGFVAVLTGISWRTVDCSACGGTCYVAPPAADDTADDNLRFLQLQAQIQAENQRFVTLSQAMAERKAKGGVR